MLHYAEDFPRNLEHDNANLSLNGANGAWFHIHHHSPRFGKDPRAFKGLKPHNSQRASLRSVSETPIPDRVGGTESEKAPNLIIPQSPFHPNRITGYIWVDPVESP